MDREHNYMSSHSMPSFKHQIKPLGESLANSQQNPDLGKKMQDFIQEMDQNFTSYRQIAPRFEGENELPHSFVTSPQTPLDSSAEKPGRSSGKIKNCNGKKKQHFKLVPSPPRGERMNRINWLLSLRIPFLWWGFGVLGQERGSDIDGDNNKAMSPRLVAPVRLTFTVRVGEDNHFCFFELVWTKLCC